MKSAAGFVFLAFCVCAASALSLAQGAKRSKPSASVSPAQQFGSSVLPTSPSPATTSSPPVPTTKPANATTTKPANATTTAAPMTTKPANATTTKPANATTTAPPMTTKPANATTTKPANATTTAAPMTTKPANATTTKPANATTTASSTTTKSANATTTAATTTTAPPAPTPSTPPQGKYSIKIGNKVCLMADMGVRIRLVTSKVNGTFTVNPNDTKAEGICTDPNANLTLVFPQGYIMLLFNKSTSDGTVYVDNLSFSINVTFTGANGPYTATNKTHLFPAKVGHSYSCRNQSLYMGNDLYLDMTENRLQAFNLTNDKDFGISDFCPADQQDYRFAIGVGVALAVVIVILLVVYFVMRKKRTDGYQSL